MSGTTMLDAEEAKITGVWWRAQKVYGPSLPRRTLRAVIVGRRPQKMLMRVIFVLVSLPSLSYYSLFLAVFLIPPLFLSVTPCSLHRYSLPPSHSLPSSCSWPGCVFLGLLAMQNWLQSQFLNLLSNYRNQRFQKQWEGPLLFSCLLPIRLTKKLLFL